MSDEVMSIGTLLAESKAAHLAYRQALQQHQAVDARQSLETAAARRRQAQALDPAHVDPAWGESASQHAHQSMAHEEIHDELLDFYARELSK